MNKLIEAIKNKEFFYKVKNKLIIRPMKNFKSKKLNKKLNETIKSGHIELQELNKEPRETNIIVSFTSLEARVNTLPHTLISIFNQTYIPDRVILYLSSTVKNKEEIKKILQNFIDKGLEIIYVEDIGPATKFFYAIKKFQESVVITIDDDIIYPDNMIENLVNSYKKHPNAISANRIHKMIIQNDKLKNYNDWDWEYNGIDSDIPSHAFFATGVGGVLYPPKIFGSELLNRENIVKYSYKADDIWLKVMELMYDIPVVKTTINLTDTVVVDNTQHVNLNGDNVGNNKNDEYLNSLLPLYNIDLLSKVSNRN